LLDVGASAPVKLTNRPSGAFSPDWSPDGQALVFNALDEKGVPQLFTTNPDGSNERQITTSDTFKQSPLWSVDGTLIAFAGIAPGPMAAHLTAPLLHPLAAWVVNADGSGERPVTQIGGDAWPLGWCLPGPWLDEGWVEE